MHFIIFLLLLFLIYLFYSFIYKNIKFSNIDPPSGGIPLPIIGNLYQVAFSKLPHRNLHDLSKKYGDVFRMWMGDYYYLVVSDPAFIREIYQYNFENFMNHTDFPIVKVLSSNYMDLAAAKNDDWYHRRKLVASVFAKQKIRQSTSIIDRQASNLLNKMKELHHSKQHIYPRRYFKKYTMNVIFKMLFSEEIPYDEGVFEGRLGLLIDPIENIFKRLGENKLYDYLNFLQPFYYLYVKLFGSEVVVLHKFIAKLYEERVLTIDPNNPKDLFETLIIDSAGKNVNTVITIATDFIAVGVDSTASAIEWLMLYMINYPEVQEKVFAELRSVVGEDGIIKESHRIKTPYTVAVIKETMRIRPLAPMVIPRVARESMIIRDFLVPKGANILVNFHALNHNEKHWHEPEKFNPDRFIDDNHSEYFMPFGNGPRNCVGLNLGSDIIYLGFANIVSTFKLKSPDNMKLIETEVMGFSAHPEQFSIEMELRDKSNQFVQ